MNTATPLLPANELLVTDPSKLVYCSMSRPEAALEERF